MLIYFIDYKLCDKANTKIITSSEAIRYLNQTNRLTNIKFEEKVCPLGSWGGKLGEIVSIN